MSPQAKRATGTVASSQLPVIRKGQLAQAARTLPESQQRRSVKRKRNVLSVLSPCHRAKDTSRWHRYMMNLFCLMQPEQFINAGHWFTDFRRPGDNEVSDLLG